MKTKSDNFVLDICTIIFLLLIVLLLRGAYYAKVQLDERDVFHAYLDYSCVYEPSSRQQVIATEMAITKEYWFTPLSRAKELTRMLNKTLKSYEVELE